MESIEELRRQLEEERRGRLEERRGRVEAESRARESEQQREEEQRRYEEEKRRYEAVEKSVRPKDIQQYLEACHALDLSAQVITNPSFATGGKTTDPVGRIFPRRIVPWDDFATQQEKIWNALSTSDSFFSNTIFP